MGSSINEIIFIKGTKEGDGVQKSREKLTLHISKKSDDMGEERAKKKVKKNYGDVIYG